MKMSDLMESNSSAKAKAIKAAIEKEIAKLHSNKKIGVYADKGYGMVSDFAFDIHARESSDLSINVSYRDDNYSVDHNWVGDSGGRGKSGLTEKEMLKEVSRLLEYEFGKN